MSLLTACQKYEDGPFFSLTSKTSRAANNWRIEKAYDGSEDVTSSYDNYELDLGKTGSARISEKSHFGGVIFTTETNGTWSFANNKEDLALDFEDNNADVIYTILKLESSEMWLRKKGGGLELHLIPR